MDRRVWLSPRALRLHAVILVVVPAFAAMCVWQITRALGGNELSWAYVFEWPLFAGYAVYMWWRLLHEPAEAESPPATAEGPHGGAGEDTPTGAPPGGGDGPARSARSDRDEQEDAELAAYNAYLAQLAERDRAAES
jgi:hypothetical protein